jgi:integrase
VRLLILTAQRRDEVACLERAELDLDKRMWTMPREKAKNNRTHLVHLSASAIEVLNFIPGVGVNFVLTSAGSTPVSGFSRAKRRIEGNAAAKREEMGEKCDPIPGWILHDLRRTVATGMARLNFPPHVVDKVLNHASGTIRGVAPSIIDLSISRSGVRRLRPGGATSRTSSRHRRHQTSLP